MGGFWNKIIDYTNEENDYEKIGFGVYEGRSWILYRSPELGFAVHGNWMSQEEEDFAAELMSQEENGSTDGVIRNSLVDDLVLASEMIPMLRKFGNVHGWKPEPSEATEIVYSVLEEAGIKAREYVNASLNSL